MNREFKLNKERLNDENKEIFKKIEFRLSTSKLHPKAYKNNINEVLNMLLEGQERNESYKEIIGEDLENFCENIIENSYKTNFFERLFRLFYIYSVAILIIMIIKSLLSLVADGEAYLLLYRGPLNKTNVVSFGILFILVLITNYVNELRSITIFKNKIIRFLVFLIIIVDILSRSFMFEILDIKSTYYISNYLLLIISLLFVVGYKAYDYLKIKRWKMIK